MTAPHPAAQFKTGQRIKLRREIDRYPHFVAPAGATGTLTEVDGHSIVAHMDNHINGAEEWDNELIWTYEDLDYIDQDIAVENEGR